MYIVAVVLVKILTFILGGLLIWVAVMGFQMYFNGDFDRIKNSKNRLKETYYCLQEQSNKMFKK